MLLENLAIERAKELFGAEYAKRPNAHSGSGANMAVFNAFFRPEITVVRKWIDTWRTL